METGGGLDDNHHIPTVPRGVGTDISVTHLEGG